VEEGIQVLVEIMDLDTAKAEAVEAVRVGRHRHVNT